MILPEIFFSVYYSGVAEISKFINAYKSASSQLIKKNFPKDKGRANEQGIQVQNISE